MKNKRVQHFLILSTTLNNLPRILNEKKYSTFMGEMKLLN